MISGLLMLAAIGISSSRGGMLGLVAVFGTMLLLSKKPFKNLIVTVAIVLVLGGSIIASLPDDYVDDMENVANPEDDTRTSDYIPGVLAGLCFLKILFSALEPVTIPGLTIYIIKRAQCGNTVENFLVVVLHTQCILH